MLAAPVVVRIEVEHLPAILEHGSLVRPVALYHIGRRKVVKPFEVGSHRRRERVERDVLTSVGPDGVAGDGDEHLVRVHEFHHGTGFRRLAGTRVARPGILIRPEHPPRNLAVRGHYRIVVPHRRLHVPSVSRLLKVLGRLSKSLAQIDAVPCRDSAGPVRRPLVVDAGQIEQPRFSRPVVEPVNVIEVIPPAPFLPAVGKIPVERHGHEPACVGEHGGNNPRITRRLVTGPEGGKHEHVRPDIRAGAVCGRTEIAGRVLA